jgi:hypothetical protein
MGDSSAGWPAAMIVPLRPPAAPAACGWHGMKARTQRRYTSEDWKRWGELGEDARLVDSERGSPAWLADVRTGTWVLSINGHPFDAFERAGAAVGTAVCVKAFFPGLDTFSRTFLLIEPPTKTSAPRRRDPPAWTRERPVLPGKRVFKDSRARYLEFAARHPFVRRHVWFLAELLKRDWHRGIIPRHATIAAAAGCGTSSVKRSQACCQHFGFVRVISGKRAHKHNTFEVCWPAGADL